MLPRITCVLCSAGLEMSPVESDEREMEVGVQGERKKKEEKRKKLPNLGAGSGEGWQGVEAVGWR